MKRLPKKIKQFNTITGIVDTGIITSTVITGGITIAAFASGVGLPVGIALNGTSLILSLATVITRKYFINLYREAGKTRCQNSCLPRAS